MASSATFTTIVIVVLAFLTYSEQRAFQRYSKYLEKAVPNHWHHDKEELGRRVDKISRWHQVERVPPLQPQEASWDRLAREGRVAAFDKNQDKEQQRVRRRLLEEKLKLNYISRKVMVQPQMKRQVEVKSVKKLRTKREILDEKSNKQLEIQPLEGIRHKRDIILNPQIQPEVMLQSHIQKPMQQETEAQYQERVKQNRDKRQTMYLMNQLPIFINLAPRTTPNPFIRETHVDEYQAIESNPPVKSDSYDDSSIMKMAQALFQYFQKTNIKIGQNYIDKRNNIVEEDHIRVKRKMSKFRRDRKQITRKKKIGRRKKTRVKRLPVKKRKWYDKRQKKPKKGDGTYRGGRGRIPRQHKRPRHYKPPRNETSDYDYYDDEGKIREPSGETQEGSEDAAYVSYGTGEYEDTGEAQAAHQQLEKEYQMQLVRERKKAERRRLSNGTLVSSEEYEEEEEEEQEESQDDEEGSQEDEEESQEDEEGSQEDEEESQEDEGGSDDSDSTGGNGGNNKKGLPDKNKGKRKTRASSKAKVKNKKDSKNLNAVEPINKLNNKDNRSQGRKTIQLNEKTSMKRSNALNKEGKLKSEDKNSKNVRLSAKKFNFVSLSQFPSIRNYAHANVNQPPNKMSSIKFESPYNNVFTKLQSMPLKNNPHTESISNPGMVSVGGRNLQNLQSKKQFSVVESAAHGKKSFTSTARDKSETPMIFTSKSKNERKKLTSLGSDHLKAVQSLTRDPLILTSIAKHIPSLEMEDKKSKGAKNQTLKVDKEQSEHRTVSDHLAEGTKKNTNFMQKKASSTMVRMKRAVRRSTEQDLSSYEELSSVPDSAGVSVPSDEVESAR